MLRLLIRGLWFYLGDGLMDGVLALGKGEGVVGLRGLDMGGCFGGLGWGEVGVMYIFCILR